MPTPLTRRTILTAAASATTTQLSGATPSRPPNVLWICTDQQRWDTINALGNPHVHTPNLDRLVRSGVAFDRAYCQSPICTPSRASFLTGLYPSTVHGCINGNENWAGAAPLVTKTLASAGYDCGLVGKLHLSSAMGRIEPRPDDGYRVFHWSHHPADDWPEGHAYKEWLTARGVDYWTTKRKLGYIPAEHHQTTWCADMTIDFINQKRSGPWLWSLNCFDPHPAFDPPQHYVDRYDIDSLPGPRFRDSDLAAQKRLEGIQFQTKARHPDQFNGRLQQALYWAQIDLIDEQVGRIMDALEQSNQIENTVVIFTSDHGETCGDHGLMAKGCRFYDSLVRVPLIISWPGHFEQSLTANALVERTDLAPTLLDLAGLPGADRMAGRSLLPLLTGKVPAGRHHDHVRSEYYRVLQGIQSYGTMIRDDRYKLVNYHGTCLGELFDLKNDPGEFHDLWQDPRHAEIKMHLMEQSFDELAYAVDTGPRRIGRY